MTSTRLTQQNRSQGWAAALPRCYPHTPSPTPGSSWHGSDAGSDMTHIPGSASHETHARTRVGGWVLRGGYADSVPRGPDHPTGGRYPRPPPPAGPPRSSPLCSPSASDCPREVRPRRPERDETSRPIPCIRCRKGATFPSALSSPSSPWTRSPPTRAVPGAPLSVTRDTRKGRDARAAPHAALRAPYQAFTQHTLG